MSERPKAEKMKKAGPLGVLAMLLNRNSRRFLLDYLRLCRHMDWRQAQALSKAACQIVLEVNRSPEPRHLGVALTEAGAAELLREARRSQELARGCLPYTSLIEAMERRVEELAEEQVNTPGTEAQRCQEPGT